MVINIKTLSLIKPDEIKKYLKTLSLTVMLPRRMVALLMMHCRQKVPGLVTITQRKGEVLPIRQDLGSYPKSGCRLFYSAGNPTGQVLCGGHKAEYSKKSGQCVYLSVLNAGQKPDSTTVCLQRPGGEVQKIVDTAAGAR